MAKSRSRKPKPDFDPNITQSFRIALPPPPRRGFLGKIGHSLRRRILAGILVMSPLIISFLPVLFLYPRLKRLADRIGPSLFPGAEEPPQALSFLISLFLVLSALFLLGLFSTSFIVRWALGLGEKVLLKIPLVDFLYKTSKQVADLIANSTAKPFEKAVMIEYPRKGVYALAFVTGEAVYPGKVGHLVHVFMPSTPNPTTGFLMMLPPKDVLETNLTVDDAVKFIISGGIVEMDKIALVPFQSRIRQIQGESVGAEP
jgi:uncharacterized membrane protein